MAPSRFLIVKHPSWDKYFRESFPFEWAELLVREYYTSDFESEPPQHGRDDSRETIVLKANGRLTKCFGKYWWRGIQGTHINDAKHTIELAPYLSKYGGRRDSVDPYYGDHIRVHYRVPNRERPISPGDLVLTFLHEIHHMWLYSYFKRPHVKRKNLSYRAEEYACDKFSETHLLEAFDWIASYFNFDGLFVMDAQVAVAAKKI